MVLIYSHGCKQGLFPATIPQRGGRFKTCGRVGTTQNLAANGVELPRIDDGRPVEERYMSRAAEELLDQNAPVFGLSAKQIGRRVQAAAKAAGLGEGFTGHSGRVGMAQDLVKSGTELPTLMTAGRWKSSRMPARYTERQAAGRGAVARYYQESGG